MAIMDDNRLLVILQLKTVILISAGENIITWREWIATSGTDIKMYTRDNTKSTMMVGGIVK
jgi:hypothetical protein